MDMLYILGIDRMERDIELVRHLPEVHNTCPDLYNLIIGFIDNVCDKFNVQEINDTRDHLTGIPTTMKQRVEVIESFRLLKESHCCVTDIKFFSKTSMKVVQLILLECLSDITTDIDLLKILPLVKKYIPSLHAAFICMVDPVRFDEPSMDTLRNMDNHELIEVMKKYGVHASYRYDKNVLLKECSREFDRGFTGLRMCTVESIHASHILYKANKVVYASVKHGALPNICRYLDAMKTCMSSCM
jgi:hypothetical protein